jgi:hypothetical protein
MIDTPTEEQKKRMDVLAKIDKLEKKKEEVRQNIHLAEMVLKFSEVIPEEDREEDFLQSLEECKEYIAEGRAWMELVDLVGHINWGGSGFIHREGTTQDGS